MGSDDGKALERMFGGFQSQGDGSRLGEYIRQADTMGTAY